MNAKTDNLITVLDAGSSKSCVLVAELTDGVLRYRGHGVEASRGMRRGAISDLGPAAEAIDAAALRAEKTAKAPIETAVVSVGGPHMRGVNSQGGINMGSRMKEITKEDVRAAIDRARSISLAPDREVLHLLPQQFILDDQGGIHDPVGMVGNRLEVGLHLVTCSGSASQNVVTCANRAGLEVLDTVFEGIAAAEAVLSADERELGVCLADIGSHSTELVVFFEGAVAHTAVLPIGGDHFTNDLAVGLQVSVEEAEQLKRMYGSCVVTSIPQLNEIEVGGNLATGGGSARLVRQRFLAEILEPRAREMLTMLRENLRHGGVLEAMGAGVVLTGGGSHLAGLLDNAESLLRVPARIGYPVPLSRMPAELAKPEFAAAIGMLLYTQRTQAKKAADEQGLKQKILSMFAGSF
ncbi:cell division protein FtsA [Granulicella sp. 5B5]|uniref:cell division protein FtsA n=1 Tax=Granulicella sp. 5B5 TaxID=1617967 RepID=UPI0015F77838|nr:cell division protein FtsA [Granulicella sp. 5B5]QMV18116.1 cell division protein FtsA [Granulicella sp. 5B5]